MSISSRIFNLIETKPDTSIEISRGLQELIEKQLEQRTLVEQSFLTKDKPMLNGKILLV